MSPLALEVFAPQELLRRLVKLANLIEVNEIDLIDSCKNQSRALAQIRDKLLSQMIGEDEENEKLIDELVQTAMKTTALQGKILDKIPSKA